MTVTCKKKDQSFGKGVKFRMEPISFSHISERNMLQASARFTPGSALEK